MIETAAQTPLQSRLGWPRLLTTPAGFLLLIGGYFTFQVGLRLITSGTADLDEAEQLVATQQFALGYGAQPPLYTWLQLPWVMLFGPTLLPLVLFKNCLLFGIFAFTYGNARLLLRDHALAAPATLSLLFLPQIAWEAQRDLTHSVLVTLCAVLDFHVFLRLVEKQSALRYLLFGLVAAAGFLSRNSYGIFLMGLLVAAMTLRPLRGVVFDRRMLLVVAACFVFVAPVVWWAMEHPEMPQAAWNKLTLGSAHLSWSAAVGKGLLSFAAAVVSHVGPLLGLYALVIWAGPAAGVLPGETQARADVIGRGLVVIAGLLIAGILIAGATRFLDRWLMEFCFWLPIWLMSRLGRQLNDSRRRILVGSAALVAIGIAVAIPTRVWFAEKLNWPQSLNAPFEVLAEEIRHIDPDPRLIVAENTWLGGNLRLQFPTSRVVCPTIVSPTGLQPGEPCLVVWDLTRKSAPSEAFIKFCGGRLNVDFAPEKCREVRATMKFFSQRQTRLGLTAATLKPTASH